MSVVTHDDNGEELLLPQEMRDPLELIPHPGNPRVHMDAMLKKGMKDFGLYQPVVVNRRTGKIICGHGRIEAYIAVRPGKKIQVSYVDKDDLTAEEMLLFDNRSSDLATNDDRLLAEMLRRLEEGPGLSRTGFDPGDLAALEALLEDHAWEGGSLDDTLDRADEAAWPKVECQLAPDLHARFLMARGDDDAERIATLIELAKL